MTVSTRRSQLAVLSFVRLSFCICCHVSHDTAAAGRGASISIILTTETSRIFSQRGLLDVKGALAKTPQREWQMISRSINGSRSTTASPAGVITFSLVVRAWTSALSSRSQYAFSEGWAAPLNACTPSTETVIFYY